MSGLRDTPSGGTGLLAIFCDLDEADRADFRPWLVEDMFPPRRAIGFTACASYDRVDGDGQQFLTLYEMESLGHLYGEAYQALRRNRDPRDAAYHAKFRNPDRYTLAWTGPELADGATTGLAEHIRVDRFDLPEDEAQGFNIRFVGEFLPSIEAQAGITRVRRYLAMEGTPTHFVLMESAAEPDLAVELPPGARETRTAIYGLAVSG
ncbi:MAG: hypothetical protein JJ899_05740 [Alphaproteobacteria bacterium]|nr:hypothetical protein [Alphaproteobacteria bacterium]